MRQVRVYLVVNKLIPGAILGLVNTLVIFDLIKDQMRRSLAQVNDHRMPCQMLMKNYS